MKHADDTWSARRGVQTCGNTGQNAMIGQTFYGTTPSTDNTHTHTFRPLNLVIALRI